jgi:hypothetical protein
MSLKEQVVSWQSGVENALAGKFEDAVDNFTEIPEPSARIFFNIASAFLRLGNLEDAERVSAKGREIGAKQGQGSFSVRLFFTSTESRPVRATRPSHGPGVLPEGLSAPPEAEVREGG